VNVTAGRRLMYRARGALGRAGSPFTGADTFPHLPAMDSDLGRALEAQPDLAAPYLEHRDFERAPQAVEPPTTTDSWLFLVNTNMVRPPCA